MPNVKIDENGELRCWKCGSKSLETRRKTGRKVAGAAAGVLVLGPLGAAAALGAKKRVRCIGCGEYNDPNPEPWSGAPEVKKSFTQRMEESNARNRAVIEEQKAQRQRAKAERAEAKAEKADAKIAAKAEKAAAKNAHLATPPQPQAVAPNWYPNPDGTPTLRWWDGTQWTGHTQTH